MDDLDLGAIRARALAAGGADAKWTAVNDFSVMVEDQNGRVVVYNEGEPSEEQSAHIACMDPATTLALLDMIDEFRKAAE